MGSRQHEVLTTERSCNQEIPHFHTPGYVRFPSQPVGWHRFSVDFFLGRKSTRSIVASVSTSSGCAKSETIHAAYQDIQYIIMAQSGGLVKAVIDLIFQPGSSVRLIPAINGVLFVLLLVLAWTWVNEVIDEIHIYVLSSLSVALMASVSFVGHAYEEAVQKAAGAAKGDSPGAKEE